MKVFAVIVTYNAMKWIEKTMRCIEDSTVPMDVVVVDNASTDETVQWLQERGAEVVDEATGASHVSLILSDRNLGFGAANNIGMKYALERGATHVLLVNQDAYVERNMLSKLLSADDSASLLSPCHFNGNHTALDQNFAKNSYVEGAREPYAVNFVNAALWLLPRNIIDVVGYFSPAFFHYGEDMNYCNRVRFHGFRIVVVPAAEVCHDRGKYGNPRLAAKSHIPNKLANIYLDPNLNALKRLGLYIYTFAESCRKLCPGAFFRGIWRLLTDRSLPRLRSEQ